MTTWQTQIEGIERAVSFSMLLRLIQAAIRFPLPQMLWWEEYIAEGGVINNINASRMSMPVMMGRDHRGRNFIAIRVKHTDWDDPTGVIDTEEGVLVIQEMYPETEGSNPVLITAGMNHGFSDEIITESEIINVCRMLMGRQIHTSGPTVSFNG